MKIIHIHTCVLHHLQATVSVLTDTSLPDLLQQPPSQPLVQEWQCQFKELLVIFAVLADVSAHIITQEGQDGLCPHV